MKKLLSLYFILILILFITGCGIKKESIKWFDYYHEYLESFPSNLEKEIDEFGKTKFEWDSKNLYVTKNNERTILYNGMPIWNVYFYDLNKDGYRELCSTISIGSGIVDDRIIVYDYHNSKLYELSDRGNFDYILKLENDKLMVEKRIYSKEEVINYGELVLINDKLSIK